MSEQDEIDAKMEKWHATPTNVGMAISSFGLVSGTVGLATHSPGGIILGAGAAWAAAQYGDDAVNMARNVVSGIGSVVKALQGHGGAYPKDARDELPEPRTSRLLEETLFDFGEEDEEEIKPVALRKSDVFRFSELLVSGFVPSVRKIFVGRTMDGKDIFISAEDLCHVALAGKTGGGKGSLMRLLMVQLCNIGTKVLLLNPHYMRWVRAKDGAEFDEDWTPFEGAHLRTNKPYLTKSPLDCADYPPIGERLEWAVKGLLHERKVEGREGDKLFKPYFIVLDEWPAIVGEMKETAGQLAKLLREGRKYGIFVIVASQDFQVKTIGMDGGSVRKCLLTTYYTGGDATTARELLGEPGLDIKENELGKGVVYLKCVGTQNKPVLVRVPFVDNESVYHLLGPSTFKKASAHKVALPQPQQQKPVVQNGALTLDEAIRLVHEHPEIDPLVFMNRIADYRETDDLPIVQQDTRVIRSPYYEQTATSSPTSFNASVATSSKQTVIYPVKWANEAARSGTEVAEVAEVAKTPLTEREKRIVDMFLEEGLNASQIAKKLSGANGGTEYTKASNEVAEVFRKAMRG